MVDHGWWEEKAAGVDAFDGQRGRWGWSDRSFVFREEEMILRGGRKDINKKTAKINQNNSGRVEGWGDAELRGERWKQVSGHGDRVADWRYKNARIAIKTNRDWKALIDIENHIRCVLTHIDKKITYRYTGGFI
jgi:hypothetical protein